MLWEILQKIVQNMLWKSCGKFCGKSCGKICGKCCGNFGLGNDAFFSLNTRLRTLYCLQTNHKPECVILTLFNICVPVSQKMYSGIMFTIVSTIRFKIIRFWISKQTRNNCCVFEIETMCSICIWDASYWALWFHWILPLGTMKEDFCHCALRCSNWGRIWWIWHFLVNRL